MQFAFTLNNVCSMFIFCWSLSWYRCYSLFFCFRVRIFFFLSLSLLMPLIHQYESLLSCGNASHRLFCSQVVFRLLLRAFSPPLCRRAKWERETGSHLSLYECWSSEVDKLHIIENNRWINKLQGVNNHTSFFLLSDFQSLLLRIHFVSFVRSFVSLSHLLRYETHFSPSHRFFFSLQQLIRHAVYFR